MGYRDSYWVRRYCRFGVMQCTCTCQVKAKSRVKGQATIVIYDRLADLAYAWEVDTR
jgi:hypothetical protein